MKKLFKFIGNGFKELFKTAKENVFWFIGVIFTWAIPIYLLGEQISLTKEVSSTWKFTFAGLCVLVIVVLAFYKKIKSKINAMKPATKKALALQMILMTLQKAITFGGIAFLLKYLSEVITKINEWYLASLIPIGIGLVFYLIDKGVKFKINKKAEREQREELKEQIKGEILNGE